MTVRPLIEINARGGGIRVVDPRLFHRRRRRFARALLASLGRDGRIRQAELDLDRSECLVRFNGGDQSEAEMASAFAKALAAASAQAPRDDPWWAPGWSAAPLRLPNADQDSEPAAAAPVLARGFKRLRYYALAGGSFALAIVGLVVPGVPTVPFLLATSYYLGRCSPALDARLRKAPFFGGIIREWEERQALSRWSKRKLIGLTAVIVIVTIVISGFAPIATVVILVISLLSILGVVRTPTLAQAHAHALPAPRQPALSYR